MKKLILAGCFLSSIIYAEGKPPEWWCRVSPDGSESKSFLQYGLTLEEACSLAMAECTAKYDTCDIDGYGEW